MLGKTRTLRGPATQIVAVLDPVFIGPHRIDPPLVLSPMAGVTDRPFRVLCRRLGAGLAVAEMAHADPALRDTEKSRTRRDHQGEPGPIAVQLAGSDPQLLAQAALWNIGEGAEIIDLAQHLLHAKVATS